MWILHELAGDIFADGASRVSAPLARSLRLSILRARTARPLWFVWLVATFLTASGALVVSREPSLIRTLGLLAFIGGIPIALLITLVWRDVRRSPAGPLLPEADRELQFAAVALLPRLRTFVSHLRDDLEPDIGGDNVMRLREYAEACLPDLEAIRAGLAPGDLFTPKIQALGTEIALHLRNDDLTDERPNLEWLERTVAQCLKPPRAIR